MKVKPMKIKLKNCPFCGHKAKLQLVGRTYNIECLYCNCKIDGFFNYHDAGGITNALKSWNKRI